MKTIDINIKIGYCQPDELEKEQHLVQTAIKATEHSYSPYSHFAVGAALLLENGNEVMGANQENAAYPSGLCAERSAISQPSRNGPTKPLQRWP